MNEAHVLVVDVVPAPTGRRPGFSPHDLSWMLAHAPSEALILRPDPDGQPALKSV